MSKIKLYKKYAELDKTGYEQVSIRQVMSDIMNSMTPKQRVKAVRSMEE